MRSIFLGTFVLISGLISPSWLEAKPAYKQAIVNQFGPFLKKKLQDCRICHLESKEDDEDKPHNDFGLRLVEVKKELRDQKKPFEIGDRLAAIAKEDSDGDGVANLAELLTGHFPGDGKDKPSPESLANLPKIEKDYLAFLNGYRWKPWQEVKRPPVPDFKNIAHPIDRLVREKQIEKGVQPRPEAPREVLMRRVYLDLTGLPPTREELEAYLKDASADAYEKMVDRLLTSPSYGERWARHWMDIWRYSDWAGWGQEVRDSQPHIWRWRDWIVESLNEDKGYDRMIQEMLAGDEIAPEDPNILRATGYLARNYKRYSRERWMQDTVDHTFMAFQGITMNCARCHDHFYDPFTQNEYYQLRAFFDPYNVRIDRLPGQADTTKDGVARVFDANLQVKTFLLIRGDDRTPDKNPLTPGVPVALGLKMPEIKPIALPTRVVVPESRSFVREETLTQSRGEIQKADQMIRMSQRRVQAATVGLVGITSPFPLLARSAVHDKSRRDLESAELDGQIARLKDKALQAVLHVENLEDSGLKQGPTWTEAAEQALTAQRELAVWNAKKNLLTLNQLPIPKDVKAKVAHEQKRTEAEKAVAKAEADRQLPATTNYTKRTRTRYPETSTGRRTAFAQWLANKQNPLTARVAVNHIWARHFGQAIVPNLFDFGANGRLPTHPALLDYLAVELMDQNWSMKKIHRLIVTSATYKQSSNPEAGNLQKDPDNLTYWRMAPHRLEAENIRDIVLYVAGNLDLKRGGPDIGYTQGMTVPRRSLYFQHAAEKQMEFLKLFDVASVTECYHRKESIMPQQALALSNSSLVIQQARLLARKLHEKNPDATQFVQAAFETVLTRAANEMELRECLAFLQQQTETHARQKSAPPAVNAAVNPTGQTPSSRPDLRARENLVHVLLNHHDFVTVK